MPQLVQTYSRKRLASLARMDVRIARLGVQHDPLQMSIYLLRRFGFLLLLFPLIHRTVLRYIARKYESKSLRFIVSAFRRLSTSCTLAFVDQLLPEDCGLRLHWLARFLTGGGGGGKEWRDGERYWDC